MTSATMAVVPRYHRWPAVLGSAAAVLLVGVATCEVLGWPFLAEPLQRWLTSALHRRVSFAVDGHTPASVAVHVLGRLRIEAPLVTIAAPSWSRSPAMLQGRDAVLSLHYVDLWRARRGEPLRVHMLEAAELTLDIERLADGRASWHTGAAGAGNDPSQWSMFDRLKADSGTLRWRDDHLPLQFTASASAPSGAWRIEGSGNWGAQPLQVTMTAKSPLPWVDRDVAAERRPWQIEGRLGDEPFSVLAKAPDALGAALLLGRVLSERVGDGEGPR